MSDMEADRKAGMALGLFTLISVLITFLAVLLLSACGSEPPRDPGIEACDDLVDHRGDFSGKEMKRYADQFAKTSDVALKDAGSQWVIAQLSADNEFAKTISLSILAGECERLGFKP